MMPRIVRLFSRLSMLVPFCRLPTAFAGLPRRTAPSDMSNMPDPSQILTNNENGAEPILDSAPSLTIDTLAYSAGMTLRFTAPELGSNSPWNALNGNLTGLKPVSVS